jgi:hypothetical protein
MKTGNWNWGLEEKHLIAVLREGREGERWLASATPFVFQVETTLQGTSRKYAYFDSVQVSWRITVTWPRRWLQLKRAGKKGRAEREALALSLSLSLLLHWQVSKAMDRNAKSLHVHAIFRHFDSPKCCCCLFTRLHGAIPEEDPNMNLHRRENLKWHVESKGLWRWCKVK